MFWLKKTKRKKYDYRELRLCRNDKRISFFPAEGVITCRNTCSPRDGGLHFPEGYFAERKVTLSPSEAKLYRTVADQVLAQLPLTTDVDILPPGATYDNFLTLELMDGNDLYYTNTHVSDEGFSLEEEPLHPEFLNLYDILRKHCTFPGLF